MVSTQQAVIPCADTGTLAVAVAATLCGAVAANKAKVTTAVIRLHTGAVHTALGTHRAADASHTAGTSSGEGRGLGFTHGPTLFQ